jgi:hypothetical protein
MRNGQQLNADATLNAEIVSTRKVLCYGGSRQATVYRLPEGGYAVQLLHRLPSGCTQLEAPVYHESVETAYESERFHLTC